MVYHGRWVGRGGEGQGTPYLLCMYVCVAHALCVCMCVPLVCACCASLCVLCMCVSLCFSHSSAGWPGLAARGCALCLLPLVYHSCSCLSTPLMYKRTYVLLYPPWVLCSTAPLLGEIVPTSTKQMFVLMKRGLGNVLCKGGDGSFAQTFC